MKLEQEIARSTFIIMRKFNKHFVICEINISKQYKLLIAKLRIKIIRTMMIRNLMYTH